MSIIFTGAGGFVGRQLVARLSAIGRDVVGVDNCEWALPAGVRAVSSGSRAMM